jgi:hypothetical protein
MIIYIAVRDSAPLWHLKRGTGILARVVAFPDFDRASAPNYRSEALLNYRKKKIASLQ